MQTIPNEDANGARHSLAVWSGAIGYFIENYDWFMFGIMAAVFSQEIFPAKTAVGSLMSALLSYAIGFLVRPLGAFVFSPIGDKFGRRTAMAMTVSLMAFGSMIVALTPSYASIGVFAPIAFLVARVLQGLAQGGEAQSAIPFMCEHAPARRGFSGSLSQAAAGAATVLASAFAGLVTWLIPEPELSAWGWRIPFLVGGLLGLYGLYLRWGIPESPVFDHMKRTGNVAKRPIIQVLREHPLALVQIGALQSSTLAYYIWATFLPTYAKLTTGQALAGSFAASTVGVAVFTVLVPVFGHISDRIGNRRIFALGTAFGSAVLLYPLFILLSVGGIWSYLLVSIIGWAVLAMVFGVFPALFVELLPPEVRVTGIGIPYQIVTALLGGTAPLLAAWFISIGIPMGICYYMMAVMVLAGLIYMTIPPTKRSARKREAELRSTIAV